MARKDKGVGSLSYRAVPVTFRACYVNQVEVRELPAGLVFWASPPWLFFCHPGMLVVVGI